MERMSSYQRVQATLNHEEPDRVPVHFFCSLKSASLLGINNYQEYLQKPEYISQGELSFYNKFHLDSLLVFTDLCIVPEAYGCKVRYYTNNSPSVAGHIINELEDYEKLEVLDPLKGGRMPTIIKATELLTKKMKKKVPVTVGYMHPLGTLLDLRGRERGLADIILHPALLHKALETVTQTIAEFLKECAYAGADGLFIAPGGYGGVLTQEQALKFGIKYDAKLIEILKKETGLHVTAHFCGRKPFIDLCLREYPPIEILSWWDKGSNLSLSEAKKKYGDKICLSSGLDQNKTLLFGSPVDVEMEAKEAIKIAAKGGGYILAPGCEISHRTPDENLFAILEAARKYGNYPISDK